MNKHKQVSQSKQETIGIILTNPPPNLSASPPQENVADHPPPQKKEKHLELSAATEVGEKRVLLLQKGPGHTPSLHQRTTTHPQPHYLFLFQST